MIKMNTLLVSGKIDKNTGEIFVEINLNNQQLLVTEEIAMQIAMSILTAAIGTNKDRAIIIQAKKHGYGEEDIQKLLEMIHEEE